MHAHLKMKARVLALTALFGLAGGASASPADEKPVAGKPGCHALLTEAECTAYLTTLAGLPEGEERSRFLAASAKLIREREVSCSCSPQALARLGYPSLRELYRPE